MIRITHQTRERVVRPWPPFRVDFGGKYPHVRKDEIWQAGKALYARVKNDAR